jgi:hypothetical protein
VFVRVNVVRGLGAGGLSGGWSRRLRSPDGNTAPLGAPAAPRYSS